LEPAVGLEPTTC